eukprot:1158702-Pelagomonas_calceolata.AAC.26
MEINSRSYVHGMKDRRQCQTSAPCARLASPSWFCFLFVLSFQGTMAALLGSICPCVFWAFKFLFARARQQVHWYSRTCRTIKEFPWKPSSNPDASVGRAPTLNHKDEVIQVKPMNTCVERSCSLG